MNYRTIIRNWIENTLKTVSILLLMGMTACYLGYALAGIPGLIWAGFIIFTLSIMGPGFSRTIAFRLHKIRPIGPLEAPQLHDIVRELSSRAGIDRYPELYYLPHNMMRAFTLGTEKNGVIGISDGMLRRMTPREIKGVLAHEISHIKHKDIWTMTFADIVGNFIRILSFAAQVLVIVNVPFILSGHFHVPLISIVIVILAPTWVTFLQFALSRTREYNADLSAAELTGDPGGLASALHKLEAEKQRRTLFHRAWLPDHQSEPPVWWRTHPLTATRIKKLLSFYDHEHIIKRSNHIVHHAENRDLPIFTHPTYGHGRNLTASHRYLFPH